MLEQPICGETPFSPSSIDSLTLSHEVSHALGAAERMCTRAENAKGLPRMTEPRYGSRGGNDVSAAQFVELATTVKEKLVAMEEISKERARMVEQLVTVQNTQQAQLNLLVTDIAILKTQHANFWKAISVVFGALSLIGGGIGFLLNSVHH